MKGVECLVTLLISLEIKIIFCAAPPVWDTPREVSKTDSVLEDVAGGSTIYPLFANDADGDTLTYSIVSQDPVSPAFTISGSDLQLPAAGVDAETETEFKLIFSVSDGNGNDVTSVEFTVTITDVNDNPSTLVPLTGSYTGSLTDGAAVGTSVFTVIASDDDVSASFTYAITAGNDPDTFEVDSNGLVKVKDANNVNSITTPMYTLTVTATEGAGVTATVLTATGVVTVTAVTTTTTTTTTTTVATVATDPSTGPNSSSLSGGETAGIVVGCVVVAAGATAAVGYAVSKKNSKAK